MTAPAVYPVLRTPYKRPRTNCKMDTQYWSLDKLLLRTPLRSAEYHWASVNQFKRAEYNGWMQVVSAVSPSTTTAMCVLRMCVCVRVCSASTPTPTPTQATTTLTTTFVPLRRACFVAALLQLLLQSSRLVLLYTFPLPRTNPFRPFSLDSHSRNRRQRTGGMLRLPTTCIA